METINCPQCGKPLRRLQVETMLGRPGFNAWCREGFCSQDCYAAAGKPEGLVPAVTVASPPAESPKVQRKADDPWQKKDPLSYSMATFCLASLPLWLLLSLLGSWNGVFQEQAIAFWFSLVLCGGLLTSGLICGIAALCGIRKHGPKRILWKSIIGIVLILGYSVLLVLSYQTVTGHWPLTR